MTAFVSFAYLAVNIWLCVGFKGPIEDPTTPLECYCSSRWTNILSLVSLGALSVSMVLFLITTWQRHLLD